MAYVNVAEWKTDQVCEWLKGLDNSVLPYVHSFTNNGVNGQQLLNLRPECLEKLGVIKLGHQEIILEAVEYLRNFHYDLDRENLQLLALRLSCQAHSLYNELSRQTDSRPVTTQTLADVASVVTAVKPLVRWLDRPPFSGQLEYNDRKSELLKLSLEMATCAQRDRFAEKPIEEIRSTCEKLAKLGDYVIQDIADPMILQPASLDLATLKKRPGDDLGFNILPSFHGNHQIAEIKFGSAAHSCGKMEEGDEIVQVNYQTVVGWERKNVLELFSESPAEVLLTLKRRPRHTKVYGQIYIKPYRLPSNKKTPYATRWQHNLPSPRPELLTIPDFTMPLPRSAPKEPSPEPTSITDRAIMLDPMLASDSSGGSDSEEVEPASSTRLYASKPRNLVQRRATITGASPTTKHWIDIEELWMELKQKHSTTFQMRDKAASCAHGLDNVQQSGNNRPQTCLGIEQQTKRKKRNDEQQQRTSDDRRVQFHDKSADVGRNEDATTTRITNERWTSSGSERKDVPSEKLDQEEEEEEEEEAAAAAAAEVGRSEVVHRGRKERGKLDKSHSAPAYDPGDSNLPEHVLSRIRGHDDAKSPSSIKANETDTLSNDNLDTREPMDAHANCVAREEHETATNGREDESANGPDQTNDEDQSRDSAPRVCTEILPVVARILQEHRERESSEEKSESTSSYVEYSSSSSSEADVNLKTQDHRGSNTNMAATNRRLREIKEEDASRSPRPEGPSILAAHHHQAKHERTPEVHKREHHQSPRQCVDSRPETTRKLDAKPRLTPPEPPPRKYFTKPPREPLPSVPDPREAQPEVAETRLEHRRLERSLEEHFSKDFEGYRDFVEKSTDFIDEPSTSGHETRTAITDPYGYTEIIHEATSGLVRDDKWERYETLRDKFTGNGSLPIGESIEFSGSRDSPDGSSCSRLPRTPDPKPKSLENKERHGERGVVNRAMMVARSIGLHAGGSGKSSGNGSPRSSRKRNLLLAKRRNVSVKDVGPGDLEGWLTYRSRGAGGAWARSWFVLKASSLYRFKAQDSAKSDCLIALAGFTASTAAEVKSRKFAFKVYHTGTVFYFAADTEDSLTLWLDSINKATLGADSQNRTSGLFSETDESDGEGPKNINKSKSSISETTSTKSCHETTMFGSLKKIGRNKDTNSSYKEHENLGASLDRKYLRFLGSRNQNVPVPTAQFRSYRRVLPTSTTNRKQESTPNSPDLRVTVAGSTFYGLSASQSATDVPSTSQDMGDYRQTTDRSQGIRGVVVGGRRSDDLRGFITLEEFMLAHQSEDRRVTMSSAIGGNNNVGSLSSSLTSSQRVTPLTSDHVHIQHRNFDAEAGMPGRAFVELALSNGMIYGHPRNGEEAPATNHENNSRQRDNEANSRKSHAGSFSHGRKEGVVYYPNRHQLADTWQNATNEITNELRVHANSHRPDNGQTRLVRGNRDSPIPAPRLRNDQQRHRLCNDTINEQYQSAHLAETNAQSTPRRFVRDNGYVGSSGDLTCCASSSSSSSETLQRARKEVTRKGSFNLVDRRRDRLSPDKHWMDSLRRSDKKAAAASAPLAEKARLKNVAQYQPPPIPSSPFEQDGMRAAFEMHLDKGIEPAQKTNRLKSLFGGGGGGGGSKSPQKPNTLDLPKDSPKTLLGSPRLHRALFRDKSTSGPQQRQAVRSGSQSPGDSGISQSLSSYSGNSQSHTLSQSFSSVSSVSDWSPDTPTPNPPKCSMGHASCQKRFSNASSRSSMTPPTLPYIPPPTSPPPDDYPGLEYPPVFEPGTYSLTDPSLMRNRGNKTAPSKANRDDNAE